LKLFKVLGDAGVPLTFRERTAFLAMSSGVLGNPIMDLLHKEDGAAAPANTVQQPVVSTAPGGNTIVIQQPPIMINQVSDPSGMVTTPPTPTKPSAPVLPLEVSNGVAEEPPLGALFVTDRTQKGFESDLLPELKRLVSQGLSPEQSAQQVLEMVRAAFRLKNQLYNILIRHQATFETDGGFLSGLESLIQTWVSDTVDAGG